MSGEPPPSETQKAAYQAGRDAFVSGSASTTCPYSTDVPGGLQILWVRGFVDARDASGAQPPAPAREPFVLRKV